MKVIIVGSGLGGLACAISCRKNAVEVLVLERAAELVPVGAGIQIPPNATKVMQYFGLEEKLQESGAIQIQDRVLRRYSDGKLLCVRPGGQRMIEDFGASYYVIHRADYQQVLYDEAVRLGAKIRLGAEVVKIRSPDAPIAILANGEEISADVVVGADGLWSNLRNEVLGTNVNPEETGDLAYRGTFSRKQLEDLKDPRILELINANKNQLWMGPEKHCSFYPLRNKTEFNLVLIRPDNLPTGTRTVEADISEMRETFKGWDPTLCVLVACLTKVLKWKLCHMHELSSWTKGHIALLGDSCHPSLPYQAQGAAMAVEDGAVLGLLLGRPAQSNNPDANEKIPSLLQLYESLRKARTTVNVLGSVRNRDMFHLPDGPAQVERDEALARVNWKDSCPWQWGDIAYLQVLLGFDAVKNAEEAVDQWLRDSLVERAAPRIQSVI